MIVSKHAGALPPPLRGRVGERGSPKRGPSSWLPLSLPLPRKGGGNERVVPPSQLQKFSNDFRAASTVHGVVFDLLIDGTPA
jgi:hypothetical protein